MAEPGPVSRRSVAEALVTVTIALTAKDRGAPEPSVLRRALFGWAFNPATRDQVPPPQIAAALDWATRASLPVAALEDTATARRALDACARALTGKAAAGATQRRARGRHQRGVIARITGVLRGRPRCSADWTNHSGLMITRSERYLRVISLSAASASEPASTRATLLACCPRSRPLAVHAATCTAGLRWMRLTLPEAVPVRTSSLSPSCTNHTGVATAVPSRLYVVRLMYLPGNVHVTGGAPSMCVSPVVISSPSGLSFTIIR